MDSVVSIQRSAPPNKTEAVGYIARHAQPVDVVGSLAIFPMRPGGQAGQAARRGTGPGPYG